MGGKINKSTKKILSVLFHVFVLVCMVLMYDAGKLMAIKLGVIDPPDKKLGAAEEEQINFMEQEEVLSTEIDPKLNQLVKKVNGGFLFRTDLPFPPHLKVVVSRMKKYQKVRVAGISDFGDGIEILSAREDEVTEYEMAGKAVRITKRESVRRRLLGPEETVKLANAAPAGGKVALKDSEEIFDPLKGKVVQFNYDGKKWKAVPTSQFVTRAWSADLEPEIEGLLVENGLRPVSHWFGSKPMKSGFQQTLSDAALELVLKDVARGALQLKMIAVEGVHGHPCAVFSMKGKLWMKPLINDLGQSIEREMTVDEGKVWFSLLYPIVMRVDMETIQSMTTKEAGRRVGTLQGNIQEKVLLDWGAVVKEK